MSPMPGDVEDDRVVARAVRAVTRWIAVFAVLAVAGTAAALGSDAAIGALGGGALALGLWTSAAAIGRRGRAAGEGARMGWALGFVVQTGLVVLAAVALLLTAEPTGLFLGFGALLAGVLAGAIESGLRDRSRPTPSRP